MATPHLYDAYTKVMFTVYREGRGGGDNITSLMLDYSKYSIVMFTVYREGRGEGDNITSLMLDYNIVKLFLQCSKGRKGGTTPHL